MFRLIKEIYIIQNRAWIILRLKNSKTEYELVVSDNGIGIQAELDFDNLKSLGLLLVKNVTDQIEGQINVNSIHGTEFKIIFKELIYKERI